MGLHRALIVDDHHGVAEALALLFRQRKICDIVGNATTAAEGKRLCQELSPCLVILDLVFPNASGVDLLGEIQFEWPHIKTLVYSGCFKESILMSAISRFPQGFVNKNASLRTLAQAVHAVCNEGRTFFCPTTSHFVREMQNRYRGIEQGLSSREKEVLDLVVSGMPSKAIASHLGISQRTVDSCRSRIMSKLGAPDIASLTRLALSLGLVSEKRIFLGPQAR